MVPPRVAGKDGRGGRRLARSFSRSAAIERLVSAMVVVIRPELLQLSLQVDGVPDQYVIEKLSSYRPDSRSTNGWDTCPFRKFHPTWDSRREAESLHAWCRCSQCCTRSECSSSIFSCRGGGLKPIGWKTFLRNHAQVIAGIDLCVVPTLTFERLFAFLVLGHGRRQLLWFEVTRHPTAEWLARQITEDFPWASAPIYLVRDNDRAYGHVFTARVRAMGIRDRPIAPGSPRQIRMWSV